MGKAIGILLAVVGIWLGVEVYLNGTDGALDSMLGRGSVEETAEVRSVPQRAGAAVEDAHAAANARRERMLAE